MTGDRVEAALRAITWPHFCPHEPHPRQLAFLTRMDREVLFGGAAGGGKSDALLMSALQFVDVPGYAALILRRTFSDLALPDAIMSRARDWLIPQDISWHQGQKTFTFPSGATLTFGYLQTANDVYHYQGSAYQYIAFDELTQFDQFAYTYLQSRLRPSSKLERPVPLRMRAASNPGGIGHDWVKAWFLPSIDPDTGEVVLPRDPLTGDPRLFIASRLRDNPSLNFDEYVQSLMGLDPVTRRQLLDGDWGARPPGEVFRREWFDIAAPVIVPGTRWVRAWDLASTKKRPATKHDPDWTVGVLMGREPDGDIVVWDVRRIRGTPGEVERLVTATAAQDAKLVGNRRIWMEQEPGSSGEYTADRFARALLGYEFHAERATGPKAERARPFASAAERHLVKLRQAPWNGEYLSELEAFPNDGLHDDQVDGSSLAFSVLVEPYAVAGATVGGSKRPGQSPYHAKRQTRLQRVV